MLLAKVYYGTTPQHSHSFYKKYYYTKDFPSKVREPVLRPGALSHQMDNVMSSSQNDPLCVTVTVVTYLL